jgi:hypothetical protein
MLMGSSVFIPVISIVVIRTIGIILLAVGLVWLGYAIWKDANPDSAQLSYHQQKNEYLKGG